MRILYFSAGSPFARAIRILLDERRRIAPLCDRLQERSSFEANPILWWEPGIVGYEFGRPVYAQDPAASRISPH